MQCHRNSNSTISGYRANYGGGVFVASEQSVTFTNTTISGNTAIYVTGTQFGGYGGGIASGNGATLTLLNSTITGNNADKSGGGIELYNANLTVTNSVIALNTADGNGAAAAVQFATLSAGLAMVEGEFLVI